MSNLSAVLHAAGDLRLEETDIPSPEAGEVLLGMDSVGICGSDVHYWTDGAIGRFVVKAPMILGHEASGVVAALGDGVTSLRVGDRVAIEPGVPCRHCSYCQSDRYNLCAQMKFCATPPVHGSLRRYYCHAADFCFKLPDHVSMEEGALLEPLSVALHACNRAALKTGQTVIICGAGPIGLVCLLAARAMGASKVCITDVMDNRLQFAKRLGATCTINVHDRNTSELIETLSSSACLGDLADVVFECSGADASVRLGLQAARPGGAMIVIGRGKNELTVPWVYPMAREVDIRGVFRYVNCYPTALELVSSGQIDVRPLVTHRYPLEQTLAAFETARTGFGDAIKVVIKC